MNKNDLINELNSFKTAGRVNREKSAKYVLNHPETFPYLLNIVFEDQKRINIKAAWVLEIVCSKNIFLISPLLDYFSQNLCKINNESALRPIAKVCSFIGNTYYLTPKNKISKNLTRKNIDLLVECNFDWLIGEHKIACKVYAMDTLLLFGREYNWVHHELKLNLEKNIVSGSAGYKAHAKNILKALNS